MRFERRIRRLESRFGKAGECRCRPTIGATPILSVAAGEVDAPICERCGNPARSYIIEWADGFSVIQGGQTVKTIVGISCAEMP